MALLRLNLAPSKRELRWFAGLWFPLFWGMVGWLALRRWHAPNAAYGIWGVAAALAIAGSIAPAVIRPLYSAMMRITFPIGWVMSYVVLVVAYFGVLTPIGWLLRRFHDPMERKLDRAAKSYWTRWEPSDPSRYFRQM